MLSYLSIGPGRIHCDHYGGEVVQGDVDFLSFRNGQHPGCLGGTASCGISNSTGQIPGGSRGAGEI